jgi:hypothetical protein
MNSRKVFINCPFDNRYFSLLKPMLFALIYLELNPQIAETTDCGKIRLAKIKRMIKRSKYSIHDLSRMTPLKKGELPRFNMPFECGVDFGMKYSGKNSLEKKRFLIIEKDRYRYQKVISDLSGIDIKAHNNKPEKLINVIRDWFALNISHPYFAQEIWLAYTEFDFDFETILRSKGCDPNNIKSLPFSDVIKIMSTWIMSFKENYNSVITRSV